jgi:hypothetical protein
MINEKRVKGSDQVTTFLPDFIVENYTTFVDFMSTAFEAEERIGFSNDLLQNLDRYRDFDVYQSEIITHTILSENITIEQDEITVDDGRGFPENDGVILIDEEVILYRIREGNVLSGILRGVSGTTKLPSYIKPGEYLDTVARPHQLGSRVENISSLTLSAFVSTIHDTYTSGLVSENINSQINRSTLLQKVKDFFQSKGTKLGIQSLFKILFADLDVDVNYPGDMMIKPSESTFDERLVIRTVPVSPLLCSVDVLERYELPDKLIGQNMRLFSYNDDEVYARVSCDYVTSYPIESEVQYDITVDKEKVVGDVFVNPSSLLMREVRIPGTTTFAQRDVDTITVQSTAGFPETGIIIINDEAIRYGSKSFNQFLNCKRGHIGVPGDHAIGEIVYGPYYLESEREINGLTYKTRSFPTGLVEGVNVVDGGLYYKKTDNIHLDKPGKDDPREVALASIKENYNYDLVKQYDSINMQYVGNYAAGVSGVFFDDDYIYTTSTNLPYYSIGKFSDDNSVGATISARNIVHVIPRRHKINTVQYKLKKGNTRVGFFVDGVSALSCNSPTIITQGKITRFEVVNGGEEYINPTVLISPNNSSAVAVVDKGKIVSVEVTTVGNYEFTPSVEISSGDGAVIEPSFDPFGRVTQFRVVDPGQNYIDVPIIQVVDKSGRGRGGQFKANVSGGQITSVDVITQGIDYIASSTYVNVISQGFGAAIAAHVEYYTFDRVKEIENNPVWFFDKGNGFLYENPNGDRNVFGYSVSPTELRRSLGDDGTKHSPILGWAYDGNPIYGPYGYKNERDDREGILRQRSGYILNVDRKQSIPDNSVDILPGLNPPTTIEYPMGTFVNDYSFKGRVTVASAPLTDENDEGIQTESYMQMEAEFIQDVASFGFNESADVFSGVLDSFNGKLCNTPDFPKELYPEGVYCYFLTVDSFDNPVFPYIIGESFNSVPMSQRIVVDTTTALNFGDVTYEPDSFDDTQLQLDFGKVERYRHPYIGTSANELILEIATIGAGSVSDFHYTSVSQSRDKMVGDITYISKVMTEGSGAVGIVSEMIGERVIKNENNWIQSRIVSHHQILDLKNNSYDTFVFVEGSLLRTTSFAIARVRSYDPFNKILDVQTITPNLIQEGDVFLDNRNVIVTAQNRSFEIANVNVSQFTLTTERSGEDIDSEETSLVAITPEEYTGVIPNNMSVTGYFAPVQRPNGDTLKEGDLWWSTKNGRLYVYYTQAEPLKDMWICTQPLGMIPLNGSSDEGWGNDEPSGSAIYHEATNNTLTISERAPGSRPDSTPLVIGDLWWSPHTGGLYVWHSDEITYYVNEFNKTGEIPDGPPPVGYSATREWVCTDPVANIPFGDDASDVFFPYPDNLRGVTFDTDNEIFVEDISVIISERAPTVGLDGNPPEVGDLWWSNANGKMYILFNSPSGDVWVVTNPSSSMAFAPYTISGLPWEGGSIIIPPGGDLPGVPGGLDVVPELEDQEVLWVLDYEMFVPGDQYEIVLQADPDYNEIVTLEAKLLYDKENSEIDTLRGVDVSALTRGTLNVSEIPDFTIIKNINNSLYEVWTDVDHQMNKGDLVTINGSSIDAVNKEHAIAKVGTVRLAKMRSRINASGEVSDAFIDDPGYGYESDFYVETIGDGIGAQIIAHVETFEMGGVGEVIGFTINSGGIGYTEAPILVCTPAAGQYARNYFALIVDGLREVERNSITYTTKSPTVKSDVHKIAVKTNGDGYLELPPVDGLIKKEIDRASGMPQLNGTSISSVRMMHTGNRYHNPIPIFSDLAGNGSGARGKCVLLDDLIVDVEVIVPGIGYTEPVVEFVEMDDIVYADSEDIGRITSINVLNPGRNIPSDLSIRPEIEVETRLLIEHDSRFGFLDEGDIIYQGTGVIRQAEATVVEYDALNHTLLIDDITGIFMKDQIIKTVNGKQAMVVNVKQAKTNIDVSGAALQSGRFVTEKSFVSSFYSVLQDSFYYQHFSYVISSQLESETYVNFVNSLVHPAGFAMFTDIEIIESVQTLIDVEPLDLDGDIQIIDIAGTDGAGDEQIIGSDMIIPIRTVIAWDPGSSNYDNSAPSPINPPAPDEIDYEDQLLLDDGASNPLIITHIESRNEFKLRINN